MKCIYCDKSATHVRGSETATGSRPVCKTHARMYNIKTPIIFEQIMGDVVVTREMKEWIRIRGK